MVAQYLICSQAERDSAIPPQNADTQQAASGLLSQTSAPAQQAEFHNASQQDAAPMPEEKQAEVPEKTACLRQLERPSSVMDAQTDVDDVRSCAPSLPSMVSEWHVVDDRLERFLLGAEDVAVWTYRLLPDSRSRLGKPYEFL